LVAILLLFLIFVCDCLTVVVPALLPPSRNVTVVVVSVPLLLPSDSKMMVSLSYGMKIERKKIRKEQSYSTRVFHGHSNATGVNDGTPNNKTKKKL
jgi:hypothetical protein